MLRTSGLGTYDFGDACAVLVWQLMVHENMQRTAPNPQCAVKNIERNGTAYDRIGVVQPRFIAENCPR
jgi:hypothetical protein